MHAAVQAYPELVPDREKITRIVQGAISSASSYVLISENSDGIQGCLVATGSEGAWFQRQQINLALLKTTIPGDGSAMLRQFMEWYRKRRAVKVLIVGFCVSERLGKLFNRVGIPRHGNTYMALR